MFCCGRNNKTDAVSNSYKLTYFNLAGRAEPIRVLFAAAGVEFVDHRIEGSEWPDMKPTTPWGALPILEVNGNVVLGQSLAIGRFVARETGFYGKTLIDMAKVDSVVDTIAEMTEKLFVLPKEEGRKEAVNNYVANVLPEYLRKIDKFLGENNDGKGFLVGDSLTLADIQLFCVVENLRKMVPSSSEVLASTPRIEQLADRVAATPKIAEYVNNRPN